MELILLAYIILQEDKDFWLRAAFTCTRNNPTGDLKMIGFVVEVFHLRIKKERWSYVESKLHQ